MFGAEADAPWTKEEDLAILVQAEQRGAREWVKVCCGASHAHLSGLQLALCSMQKTTAACLVCVNGARYTSTTFSTMLQGVSLWTVKYSGSPAGKKDSAIYKLFR